MAKSLTDLSISCAQSGTDFAGDITQALAAVNSCHRSDVAPTYNLEDGVLWLDTGSSDYILKIRIGGAWVTLLDHDGSDFETTGQAAIKTTAESAESTADAALPKAGGTMTGNLTIAGTTETVSTEASGFTPTLADGTLFVLSAAGTVTMPTAEAGKSFTIVVNTGTDVSWSGSISWSGGDEPDQSNGIDSYVFICVDGSTWLGAQSGSEYA